MTSAAEKTFSERAMEALDEWRQKYFDPAKYHHPMEYEVLFAAVTKVLGDLARDTVEAMRKRPLQLEVIACEFKRMQDESINLQEFELAARYGDLAQRTRALIHKPSKET